MRGLAGGDVGCMGQGRGGKGPPVVVQGGPRTVGRGGGGGRGRGDGGGVSAGVKVGEVRGNAGRVG